MMKDLCDIRLKTDGLFLVRLTISPNFRVYIIPHSQTAYFGDALLAFKLKSKVIWHHKAELLK